MLNEDACPLIIGQWGLQCSAGAMCHKHEPNADNGIASRIITIPETTSLNRHVMFLNGYYPGNARIGCDGNHSRAYSRTFTVPLREEPMLNLGECHWCGASFVVVSISVRRTPCVTGV